MELRLVKGLLLEGFVSLTINVCKVPLATWGYALQLYLHILNAIRLLLIVSLEQDAITILASH